MTPLDCCRGALAEAVTQIASTLPPGRTRRLLALVGAGDMMAPADEGVPVARPGWNLALCLCLDGDDDEAGGLPANPAALAAWADRFLTDCDQIAAAGLVLTQCELGQFQLQQRGPRAFAAWPASRPPSPEQRERADFDWWSEHAARLVAPRLAPLLAERPHMRALLTGTSAPLTDVPGSAVGDGAIEQYYRRLGEAYTARFTPQHSYPAGAVIGGMTAGQYVEILATLIGWLLREQDRRDAGGGPALALWNERTVVSALAGALRADPLLIERALQSFVLDGDNATYHNSTLSSGAAPPLIRARAEQLIPSAVGLLGEPMIFLARELRRRHAQEYHNNARLREEVFRQDLYRLFGDKRFVSSPRPVELKRSGKPRTDIDALVFDRKMGALGVFELKAQDPFARSVEERQRQRDNFFHANRQVSAVLEWVQRYGPDDLLLRFDDRTARRFHVQKVYVFVLGRYLAHFTGGPQPDRRAAWGSWPEMLRTFEDQSLGAGHRDPLGALFARLGDGPSADIPGWAGRQTIVVRDVRLHVFPSFAATRAEEDRWGGSGER